MQKLSLRGSSVQRRDVFPLISLSILTQKQVGNNLGKFLLQHLWFSIAFRGNKMILKSCFAKSVQTELWPCSIVDCGRERILTKAEMRFNKIHDKNMILWNGPFKVFRSTEIWFSLSLWSWGGLCPTSRWSWNYSTIYSLHLSQCFQNSAQLLKHNWGKLPLRSA